jgi:hypothetical protein
MATKYSTSITTNGLISVIDNQNPKGAFDFVKKKTRVNSGTNALVSPDPLMKTFRNANSGYRSTLDTTAPGASMFIWVKRTGNTTGSWDPIFLWDDGGPNGRTVWFGFYFNQTFQIHCSLPYWSSASGGTYWSVDPTWANAGLTGVVNQWYLLGFTYNNSSRVCRVYINANQGSSGTRPGHPGLTRTSNDNTAVTAYGMNSATSNQQTDAYWMWNRELSQSDVLSLFNNTKERYGY